MANFKSGQIVEYVQDSTGNNIPLGTRVLITVVASSDRDVYHVAKIGEAEVGDDFYNHPDVWFAFEKDMQEVCN
jgi:hypothetical protein